MSISIIVCHHRGKGMLDATIKSLQRCYGTFEIIVASSYEMDTEWKDVRVIHVPGGPAIKRNVASRFAHYDRLAFFDDDVEVEPNALLEMDRFLDDSGMVFGKLKNFEHRDRFDEAGGFLTWTGFIWARSESGVEDIGQYEAVEEIFAGKSAACMIRRDVFAKVGFFDKHFEILGEESDLAWRVWLSGYRVLYCPQSITWHKFNTKYKPIENYTHDRVYRNGVRNYITMLASNLEWFNVIRILPVHILLWVIAGIGKMMTGKFRASLYIFKGLGQVSITHILKRRRQVAGIRIVRDRDLHKIIFRSPNLKYYLRRFWHYITGTMHG